MGYDNDPYEKEPFVPLLPILLQASSLIRLMWYPEGHEHSLFGCSIIALWVLKEISLLKNAKKPDQNRLHTQICF